MFDFAWSEIVLIGAVALIAIGPKDMPAAIRTVSNMVKKARRMAAEFQTHVDEDLIFDPTEGRNTLAGGSTRTGLLLIKPRCLLDKILRSSALLRH